MIEIAPRWRVLAAGVAAATAGVLGFAGTTASAEPLVPQPPAPAPATVTQTVTVTPNAAALTQQGVTTPGVTSATAGTPAGAAAPAGTATPAGAAPAAGTAATHAGTAAAPAGTTAPGLAAQPVPPAPVATITPATSGTLSEFFADKGVKLEPQNSREFKALTIVLPMPRGWSHVPDPNVPDAFAVIADRVGGNGLYTSNAQVVVYKLVGEFDPKEAISHGFIDSQKLPAWRTTDASLAEFGGMPSAVIEGTYRENNMTLNTSRRHVIATAGPDKYLVSLSVTTSVDQVVPAAEATDAIVNGFRVTVPGAPAAAPPAAPAAPGAPAPAAPGAASPVSNPPSAATAPAAPRIPSATALGTQPGLPG
ncbi:LpqN/LpqT family lipoprotein [Mycolicibacterium novocastrense]|uniref:LpqN/LpqT family lipoprotein n=1 Tax=Mycolicibacterium novocastrense TaxID=59813 RepID=A0AAW5SNM1_MYCNV|nr:LpqN/LpqT family lipoprotein [Mycolicibacterium novocastrense]MCV7025541.1 LpqN/LpqT family lipoprotein [Mycolicibacterium novocastrense]GAT08901.1 proline rich protein Mtc28 [Mycolicibacterium novocastrense]